MAALSSFAVGDTVYTCYGMEVQKWQVRDRGNGRYLYGRGTTFNADQAFATEREAIADARRSIQEWIEHEERKLDKERAQVAKLDRMLAEVVGL